MQLLTLLPWVIFRRGFCLSVILTGLAIGNISTKGQQPPANDYLSNSVVLTGSSCTFTGTTAGATVETNATFTTTQEQNMWGAIDITVTNTVWFAWRPSEPSMVVIEPQFNTTNLQPPMVVGIFFHSIHSFPGVLSTLSLFPLDTLRTRFTFFADTFLAGTFTNYYIGIAGGSGPFAFKFNAYPTNNAIFLKQPQSQTVPVGGSALLSVDGLHLWTGYDAAYRRSDLTLPGSFFGYKVQWKQNGQNVTNGYGPLLLISDIATNHAGSYWAVVSNEFCVSTSNVATLNVVTSNEPSVLSIGNASGNPSLALRLSGDIGRAYRFEASDNLIKWTPYTNDIKAPFPSSVLSTDTNGVRQISVSKQGTGGFIRAVNHIPTNNTCAANLRLIQLAKERWAADNYKTPTNVVAMFHIIGWDRYIYPAPSCPQGGLYSYSCNAVNQAPSCSISNHVFEMVH